MCCACQCAVSFSEPQTAQRWPFSSILLFSLPVGCPWRIFDCQTRMMLLTKSSVWYLLNRYPSAICTLEEKSLLSRDYVSECPEGKKSFLYVGIFYRWYEAHRDTLYIFILKWKDAYITAIGFLLYVKASLSVFSSSVCFSFVFVTFLCCPSLAVQPHITRLRNVTAVEGSAAMISCKAEGEPLPEISWRRTSDGHSFSAGVKVQYYSYSK